MTPPLLFYRENAKHFLLPSAKAGAAFAACADRIVRENEGDKSKQRMGKKEVVG